MSLNSFWFTGRIYLEKRDIPELRKAGECFSLAGNYKTAAEAFAQGNFFKNCLSACSKEHLFDMGFKYIKSWKQEASWNSATMACFKDKRNCTGFFGEMCFRLLCKEGVTVAPIPHC